MLYLYINLFSLGDITESVRICNLLWNIIEEEPRLIHYIIFITELEPLN